MKEIGGYLELELDQEDREYYKGLVSLNTGRNALEYILQVRGYKKVYLPHYHCQALMTPLARLNIPYECYDIDYDFEFNEFEVKPDEAILYINFYGLKDDYINKLAQKYPTLIVDNAHAFFSAPLQGVDTFYSCRKFFGVPDGAYLSIDKQLETEPERDLSFGRYQHLIGRLDQPATEHYGFYREVEIGFTHEPVKLMSHSTKRVLSAIDYAFIRKRRMENFEFLHSELKDMNRLKFSVESAGMSYPLLTSLEMLHKLIKAKVYIGIYWPNVIRHAPKESIEYDMALNLISLPIDQRYDINDMKEIIQRIKND
jgi:hypothetical protein